MRTNALTSSRMIKGILIFLILCIGKVYAQPKILHYSETSGYDHNTRSVSFQMTQAMASTNGWTVVDDQTGAEFNSLANLEQFDVVLFSNTSGDAILDANQRSNFESYIANGGSYLGIHAASDTYRHSTANGSNTGTWDFYAEMIGASVQQSPNHVSGTPQYSMDVLGNHPSTANLPDPWLKNEEYYYWENGYFGIGNIPVLEVEETIGPNNQVNSYDAERPMSWYKELPSGGKIFYTALGHAASNFTSDQNFYNHIEDALIWIISETVGINQPSISKNVSVRIENGMMAIQFATIPPDFTVSIYNSIGQLVITAQNQSDISISEFTSGVYVAQVANSNQIIRKKILIP